jgi:hypothetical protein
VCAPDALLWEETHTAEPVFPGHHTWTTLVLNSDLTVPWLRLSVSGLSARRSGFDPRSVRVGFVVEGHWFRSSFEYFGIPRQNRSASAPHISLFYHLRYGIVVK